jgi:hypothetical protein
MPDLITVPTITFNQGDIFAEDPQSERPIQIDFYDGTICLRQIYEGDNEQEIILSRYHVEKLFKEIKKHLPAVDEHWKQKSKK